MFASRPLPPRRSLAALTRPYEPKEKPSNVVGAVALALDGYDGDEGGGVVPGGVASVSAARAVAALRKMARNESANRPGIRGRAGSPRMGAGVNPGVTHA